MDIRFHGSFEKFGPEIDIYSFFEVKIILRLLNHDFYSMTISYISKATWPVVIKFHIQPSMAEGTKNCSNGLGHMASMAAIPMYGKNL